MPSARSVIRLVPFALALAFGPALSACNDSPNITHDGNQGIAGLTITGSNTVQTGHSTVYTATSVSSNGTRQTVTPTWTVNDSTIASVTSGGELAGRDHGVVQLSAAYQTVHSTKDVVVVHDYDGHWVGQYVVRSCDQSGLFTEAGWCQALSPGSVLPIALDIQSNAGRPVEVGVTVALGTIGGNLSGVINDQGQLNMAGPFSFVVDDVTFTVTIGDWNTPLSTDHHSMIGGWAQDIRAAGVAGNAYQRNEIVALARVSSATAVTRVAPAQVRTWPDLFARMRAMIR